MKVCYACSTGKDESEFYTRSSGRSIGKCKSCCKAYVKARRRGEVQAANHLKVSEKPTRDEVEQLLSYDRDTGIFKWKVPRGLMRAGEIAGTVNKKGYRIISLGGRQFKAHRLAWLLVHGIWPMDTINHDNGHKDDNRIANLEDMPRVDNTKHAHRSGLIGRRHKDVRGRFVAHSSQQGLDG